MLKCLNEIMPVIAKVKYLRIAPRKVRLVADLIRGKKIEEAQTILKFAKKRGAYPLSKLLNSAIANAKNNFQLDPKNLYISKITVDEGPKYKRWMPRARGAAYEIQKKTSHITIVLTEIAPAEKIKKIKKKAIKKEPSSTKATEGKEKPKFRKEEKTLMPKPTRGLKRIFRRKAF